MNQDTKNGFFETNENYCPVCGAMSDAVVPTDGTYHPPSPHDITICAYCSSVLEFTDDMNQIVCTPETFNSLAEDVQLQIVKAVEASKIFAHVVKKHADDINRAIERDGYAFISMPDNPDDDE